MKCFNNLSFGVNANINNKDINDGTVVGTTVSKGSVSSVKDDPQPIDTTISNTTETKLTLDANSTIQAGQSTVTTTKSLTQTIEITSVEDFVGSKLTINYPLPDTTDVYTLDYPIDKPTIIQDERKIIYPASRADLSPYSINCSVGIYQPDVTILHPIFSGTCVVEFYRKLNTIITVLDSKVLHIPMGLDDISNLNAFNSWEFKVPSVPSIFFNATPVLRLSFNPLYCTNDNSYENKYDSLGVRIRGVNGTNSYGFLGICCAIVIFKS
jgi:hypothetical protein